MSKQQTQQNIPNIADDTLANKIKDELEKSLNNSLNYNIYLNRFEIKNSIADTLNKLLKTESQLKNKEREELINQMSSADEPTKKRINDSLQNNYFILADFTKEDGLNTFIEKFDEARCITQIQQSALPASKPSTPQTPQPKPITQTSSPEDIQMQNYFKTIETIASGINKFNKANPNYALKLDEIPVIVNYYRYVYVYRLVKSVEDLLVNRSNNVYVWTYIISSLYDECKIEGQPFIDIAPQYIKFFRQIIKARTKGEEKTYPIYGCVSDSGITTKNDLDKICENLIFLIKVAFTNDKTLQDFILGNDFGLNEKNLLKDSEVDKSETLKSLELSKVGGGLNFDFKGTENFINKEYFYQIFTTSKRKVLAQNKRKFISDQNGVSKITNIFNNHFLNKFAEIKNDDLKTSFILFLYKFYDVNKDDIIELVNLLTNASDPQKFIVQLDALKDIITVHDVSMKEELVSQAMMRDLALEKNKTTQQTSQTTTQEPKQSVFSGLFGKNKTGGDNSDAKTKAEDAINRLKNVMSNLKMPSSPPLNPSKPVETKPVETKPVQSSQEGGKLNDQYYNKYLKYKQKYEDLKKQMRS